MEPTADLTIFDPRLVIDKSTYQEPAKYAEGIRFVIVNGVTVVKEGELQSGVYPDVRSARLFDL